MATISQLNIRLGLISQQFDRDLKAFESKMQATASRMSSIGTSLSVAITAPLVAIGAFSIKTAGEMEQLRLGMETTMAGIGRGAADAAKEIAELQKIALAPGIDFEQAVKGSLRLQGVGLSAERARAVLVELANALAASGGSAEQLDGVTRQFTQMIGKGKILQQDLTIILENMPALAKVMRDEFGTATAEGLRDLGINADEFISRLTDRMQTMPRAVGGISNAIVNAGVAVKQAAAKIGEALNRSFNITGNLEKFADWITRLSDWFAGLDNSTRRAILGIGVFVAAIGPALKVVSLLVSSSTAVYGAFARIAESFRLTTIAGTGTLGLFSRMNTAMKLNVFIAAASAILALVVAFKTLDLGASDASESTRLFAEGQAKVTEQAAKETAALNRNFEVLKNSASTTDQRRQAISELTSTYPNYLRGINLETASLTQLNEIQGKVNSEIIRGIAERQKALSVEGELEKAAKAQLRITQLQQKGFEALTGEEVTRGGFSLFGTDFEKRAVFAASRASVVSVVINKLSEDIKKANKNATELADQFDKTFAIGRNAVGSSDIAASAQEVGDVFASTSPALQEYARLLEQWEGNEKRVGTAVRSTVDETKKAAEAERERFSAIRDFWSKPIDVKIPEIAIPTLPRVNPLGVSGDIAPDISLNQITEGLLAMNQLTAAAQEFIGTGLTPIQQAIEGIGGSVASFGDTLSAAFDKVALSASLSQGILSSINSLLSQGETAFGAYAKAALKAGLDAAQGAAIEGIFSAVKSALKLPFPLNLAAAGLAAGATAALFAGLRAKVKLAQGGVIRRPTMAMVGEYPGAATNPEIVAPESKLREIFRESAAMPSELFSIIRGDDLLLVTDRAAERRRRIR